MAHKIIITSLLLAFAMLYLGCAAGARTGESPAAGYIRQGNVLIGKGDYKGASKLFRKAVGFEPQNAKAYRGLGLAYYGIEDFYRAEVFMRKALQLDPQMSELWGYLGDIYMRKGDEEAAMSFFERCPPDDPHYAELHFVLGKMRIISNKLRDADDEFTKALSHTDFWGGYWGKGRLAEIARDWNTALDWYRQAYSKAQNEDIYFGLANTYYALGHYDPAFLFYVLYCGSEEKPDLKIMARIAELERIVDIEIDDDKHELEFALNKNEIVRAGVYDKGGRMVQVLYEGMLTRGTYNLTWDGCDQMGIEVDDGEYIGVVTSGDELYLRKFLVR